jgi:hypothetical protein
MKTFLAALLVCAASFLPASAQEQPGPSSKRIDAFGAIQISDFLARADNLAVELQNNPTAKGYVVAYIVPNRFPGFPLRQGCGRL